MTENQDLSTHLVRPVVRPTIPQKKSYFGANAAKGTLSRNRRPERQKQIQQRNNQNNSNEGAQATARNSKLKTPRLHSGNAYDRPETTQTKLPPIP